VLKDLRGEGKSWETISQSFPGRDARSCKNRYYNAQLNDGEKRVYVTCSEADDVVLKDLKGQGGSWETISQSFPGRDAISCKNRYNRRLNEEEKRPARIAWSKENDKLLMGLKAKGGSWEKIATSLAGRTVGSCQQRYRRIKGSSNPSKGAARASRSINNHDSSDDDEDNNSFNDDNDNDDNDDDNNDEENSESAVALLPLDNDYAIPPVISSSAINYYPRPLPRAASDAHTAPAANDEMRRRL
jgi:hypothetical protein